jgi:hypothetical protein
MGILPVSATIAEVAVAEAAGAEEEVDAMTVVAVETNVNKNHCKKSENLV